MLRVRVLSGKHQRSLGGETMVVKPEVRRVKPLPPDSDAEERITRPFLGLPRFPCASCNDASQFNRAIALS